MQKNRPHSPSSKGWWALRLSRAPNAAFHDLENEAHSPTP